LAPGRRGQRWAGASREKKALGETSLPTLRVPHAAGRGMSRCPSCLIVRMTTHAVRQEGAARRIMHIRLDDRRVHPKADGCG
jgi:hypothetical protein